MCKVCQREALDIEYFFLQEIALSSISQSVLILGIQCVTYNVCILHEM